MPPLLALFRKLCHFWWLTITLPRRERRSQDVWEASPPPFKGVPLPMGHLELKGLWPNWQAVSQVLAAHNRRVDAWVTEHGGPVGSTIVLEPDPLPYFPGWLKPPDSSPGRFDLADAIGGAGSGLVAGLMAQRELRREERRQQEELRLQDLGRAMVRSAYDESQDYNNCRPPQRKTASFRCTRPMRLN